jgi:hypothetical protein
VGCKEDCNTAVADEIFVPLLIAEKPIFTELNSLHPFTDKKRFFIPRGAAGLANVRITPLSGYRVAS